MNKLQDCRLISVFMVCPHINIQQALEIPQLVNIHNLQPLRCPQINQGACRSTCLQPNAVNTDIEHRPVGAAGRIARNRLICQTISQTRILQTVTWAGQLLRAEAKLYLLPESQGSAFITASLFITSGNAREEGLAVRPILAFGSIQIDSTLLISETIV